MSAHSQMPAKQLTPEQLREIQDRDLRQGHARGSGWTNGAIKDRRNLLGYVAWLEAKLQQAAEHVDGLLMEMRLGESFRSDEYDAGQAWLTEALAAGIVKAK